jgi:hypothetical protein
MTGDDVAVLADQDRVGKSECADAARDLRDLRIGVRASISRRGNQPFDRPMLKSQLIAILIGGGGSVSFVAHFMFPLVAELPPPPEFRGNFSADSANAVATPTCSGQ